MSRPLPTLIVLAALSLGSGANAETIAITNARLETITAGTIENGTIVLEDRRIVALGRNVSVPSGARTIDAAGGVVTPGIVAPSTNITAIEVNMVLPTRDDGSGEYISAGFDVQYVVNPASTLLAIARQTGVTHSILTPTVGRVGLGSEEHDHGALQGGGDEVGTHPALFAGQAAIVQLAADTDPVMRAKVAVVLELGETGAARAGGSRGAALLLVKSALADARHLSRHRAAYERGETRSYGLPPLDLEALIPVVEGRTPLLIRVNRAADIRQALRLAREEKIRIILEDAEEAWLVADEISAARVPVLIDPQADLPRSFETLSARLDNAARLQRAGVVIAIKGSKNFNSLRPVRLNAGTAVAYGLTREQALAAITINPARIWGIADRIGSLEVGKNADVVLWNGDPLEILSYPLRVFIGGVEQPEGSRRQELRDRYMQTDESYPPAYH
jgi:imidazolonepropionase-like amidohydrolase